MAFGQHSGPPASSKQIAYLLALVKEAGHTGFRDARGPLGLSQRQAGGKFTVGEASELIDQLVNGEAGDPDRPPPSSTSAPGQRGLFGVGTGSSATGSPVREARVSEAAASRHTESQAVMLRGVPAHLLVAELERRGYVVKDPTA